MKARRPCKAPECSYDTRCIKCKAAEYRRQHTKKPRLVKIRLHQSQECSTCKKSLRANWHAWLHPRRKVYFCADCARGKPGGPKPVQPKNTTNTKVVGTTTETKDGQTFTVTVFAPTRPDKLK